MLKRREDKIPRIMGVVNVTPDSFHAKSRTQSLEDSIAAAIRMTEEGVDWIDVGGESTRPGSNPVSIKEELDRVVPTIEGIRSELPKVCISIDTRRAEVARRSLESGADMVNDVSSLNDPGMLEVIVEHGGPICVMHMKGLPKNMQDDPKYNDVVNEVKERLSQTTDELMEAGVMPEQIVTDPGIGFGKTLEHNLALLSSGREIVPDDRMGLMWGVSRKSMFRDLLGRESSDDRLAGSLGVAAMSIRKGVDIMRVHDVAEHLDIFSVMSALE